LTFHTLLIDLIFERKRSKRRHRLLLFSSHRLLSFSFFLRAIKRKIKEKDGEESRRGIRLPVQGSINRRLRSREIEPPLPIYSQRVLFGVQVHHWRRIRYSHSSSYYYLTLSLSIYSLLHFAWSTSILNVLLLVWFLSAILNCLWFDLVKLWFDLIILIFIGFLWFLFEIICSVVWFQRY
jgi:hypothetical protein